MRPKVSTVTPGNAMSVTPIEPGPRPAPLPVASTETAPAGGAERTPPTGTTAAESTASATRCPCMIRSKFNVPLRDRVGNRGGVHAWCEARRHDNGQDRVPAGVADPGTDT